MPEKRSLGEAITGQQAGDPVFFFHPSAKIVKFAPDAPPAATSQSTPSADFDYPVDTIETLPWQSPAERTVAVGRLRLEMISGLSPFLKCGTVVQAILKNSQCWCVDGKSTFVLRIRSLTYYRIELPNSTPEEEELIAQFKSALAKVLRYEVTPCPFRRGFSVPLPADAHLPKKKRAWRPKHRRESAPAASDTDNARLNTNNELGTGQQPLSTEISDGEVTDDSTSTTTNSVSPSEHTLSIDFQDSGLPKNSDKRSTTEPAHSVHDILARFQPIPESDSEDDAESFYSLLPPDIKAPPSPSYMSPPASPHDDQLQDLPIPRHRPHGHNRDVSAVTITPESIQPASQVGPTPEQFSAAPEVQEESKTSQYSVISSESSEPSFSDAPTASASGTETLSTIVDQNEPSSLTLRRGRSSGKRDLSPLPPASTLEYADRPASSTKDMTTTIFHKTCSLVLIPPLQLLLLLIHIASRIVAGQPPQATILDAAHKTDNEDDDSDFQMPNTPGTFRRSLLLGDPSDSLSDLE
jgi:Inheritance of peroxisomes protein 1